MVRSSKTSSINLISLMRLAMPKASLLTCFKTRLIYRNWSSLKRWRNRVKTIMVNKLMWSWLNACVNVMQVRPASISFWNQMVWCWWFGRISSGVGRSCGLCHHQGDKGFRSLWTCRRSNICLGQQLANWYKVLPGKSVEKSLVAYFRADFEKCRESITW